MKRFNRTTYLLLIIYILIGNALVFLRPINSSEAYNIRAAKNVLDGNVLYVDILYHHTPLLPYVYSVFSGFGFGSYVLLRYISMILTLILVLLVHFHVYKFTGDKESANFALFLIVFNGLFIDWSSVVLMFPLANLLFYSAFLCTSFLIQGLTKKYLSVCFLIGLLSGLSASTRLSYLIPGIILFSSIVWFFHKSRLPLGKYFPYLSSLIFGFLLSSFLTIYFLAAHTEYFIYGVFGHNIEAQQVLWESGTNLLVWVKFFFLPQNFILFMIVFICLKYNFKGKGLAYAVLISMLIIHSLGYYINMYFMVLVPFAALIAGVNYRNLKQTLVIKSSPVLKYIMALYVLAIVLGIPHFKHLVFGDTLDPNLIQLKEIVDYERTLPGKTILASWDAFSIFSEKKNLLKNELLYSFTYDKVTKEEIQKFSLPDYETLNRLIRDKTFDVIILHEGIPSVLFRQEGTIRSNYKLDKSFQNIYIYTKP